MLRAPRLARWREATWQSITAIPSAAPILTRCASATLEASLCTAEHRLAEENSAQPDAVKPAYELAVAIGFDAVCIASPMQLAVGGVHFGSDPGADAARPRRGARLDHRLEITVDGRLEAAAAQRLRQAPRAMKLVREEDTARGSGDHHRTG